MKEISNSEWNVVCNILQFVSDELPRTTDTRVENIKRKAKQILKKHGYNNKKGNKSKGAIPVHGK